MDVGREKGRGVVATKPFSKGDFLCEYAGDLLMEKDAKKREEDYSHNSSIGCYMYYFTHKMEKWWYVSRPFVAVDVITSILVWMQPRSLGDWVA